MAQATGIKSITLKIQHYRRIAVDIVVDLFNNTILRDGLDCRSENLDTSLTILEESNKSIIRWGDGESFILLRDGIYFQDYSPKLRDKMLAIVESYDQSSPYFLCLPSEFLECSIEELHQKKKGNTSLYQLHKGTRYLFHRYFKKDQAYLTHYIFKGDTQAHFNRLIRILARNRVFIVVKSDSQIVDTFFSRFLENKEYHVVDIPGKNAFQHYEQIRYEIISRIDTIAVGVEDLLILVSAGPCAKVLTCDLSLLGFQTYDIGKFFECWIDNPDVWG